MCGVWCVEYDTYAGGDVMLVWLCYWSRGVGSGITEG